MHGYTPSAYFELRTGRPTLSDFRGMLIKIDKKVGLWQADIAVSPTDARERYLVAVVDRQAADLFEKLLRQAGISPQRTSHLPEQVMATIRQGRMDPRMLATLGSFASYMHAAWN